jgi:hypothetical protein
MSPLPLFLMATAILSAFAIYLTVMKLRPPAPVRRPLALRQKRAEEQIRWDRMNAPTAETGA